MGYYEIRKEVATKVRTFLEFKERNPKANVQNFIRDTKMSTGCTNKMIEEYLKDHGLTIVEGELVKDE